MRKSLGISIVVMLAFLVLAGGSAFGCDPLVPCEQECECVVKASVPACCCIAVDPEIDLEEMEAGVEKEVFKFIYFRSNKPFSIYARSLNGGFLKHGDLPCSSTPDAEKIAYQMLFDGSAYNSYLTLSTVDTLVKSLDPTQPSVGTEKNTRKITIKATSAAFNCQGDYADTITFRIDCN